MMKRAIVLVLLAAAIMGISTARSDLDLLREIKTIEEEEINELAKVITNAVEKEEVSKPACCNRCGACTRKWPPESNRCSCSDLVRQCHPSCTNCERAKGVYPSMYRCLDFNMWYLDCHRMCDHASTGSDSIN